MATEAQSPSKDHNRLRHLAIIMDGNGRWARSRGLPRHEGHRKGVESLRNIVRAARDHDIEYLTLYSFSTENWSRPLEEINELFKLLRFFIRRDLAELHQNNVRVRIIGLRDNLPEDIDSLLSEAESLTANNTAQTLAIAFNYGSRQELLTAFQAITGKVISGDLLTGEITESLISNHLFTGDMPDPDLILRTAGEKRLSNFLLWQAAYSEFVFVEKCWPEFTSEDLAGVVKEFSNRQRKYGGLADGKTGASDGPQQVEVKV